MNVHIKSVLCALAFSLLFYSKGLGLNIFIISIIIGALLATNNKEKPVPWLFLGCFCFTGLMVFISPSTLNIFAYLVSFLVLVGKFIAYKSSTYIAGLLGIVSICTASIGNLITNNNRTKDIAFKNNSKTLTYFKGALIALVLIALFATLYRKANPIFNKYILKIDFSFISINWLLFTILGYFFFQHILRPFHSEELVQKDAELPNYLRKPEAPFPVFTIKKLSNEITLSSIVFASLNLLLIFFLVTDITYLTNTNEFENTDFSKSVHQGVYALVFSIVCAIAIILYFFRGNLNFYEKNKPLLYLTYLWIGLNSILTLITCYKNYSYVAELGFTYKRIGVFIYLLLVLGGLATAAIKVAQQKNFWFLIRSNTTIAFMLLIVSSAIPWDSVITKYNLANIENPDIYYLIKLKNSDYKALLNYSEAFPEKMTDNETSWIKNRYKNSINDEASKSWQELTLNSFNN